MPSIAQHQFNYIPQWKSSINSYKAGKKGQRSALMLVQRDGLLGDSFRCSIPAPTGRNTPPLDSFSYHHSY